MTRNKRNIAKKQTKKHSIWREIAMIGVVALVMAGGLATWYMTRTGNANVTRMHATYNTPTAATFSDSNDVLFGANDIPTVNNNRTLNKIQPLVISYDWKSGPYQRTFRPELTDADIARGVKISPFVRGTFAVRGGGDEIVFTPESDWPADTDFTVRISRDMINSGVTPDRRNISFTTPAITATVSSFNLYPAPDAKKSVIGVAVITFNYPIETQGFADKLSVRLDDAKLDFDIRFDKFHRSAIITTTPVKITNAPQVIRIKLNRINPIAGNGGTKKLTAHATVAASDNIFRITDITTTAADDNDGNARQLVLVNMTGGAANNTDWKKFVNIYLLPEYKTDDERDDTRAHRWSDDEITPDVLAAAKKLSTQNVRFVNPTGVYQYAFSYDVSSTSDRFIYVSVSGGITSDTGFTVKNGLSSVLPVAYPARTVKIAGDGALVSMAGDQKLGIMARGGVTTAYVNLYRVKSSEINHLISQTYNIFNDNIEFKSWSFGADDMSVVFRKRIPFSDASLTKTNYAAVDLGEYVGRARDNDNAGIFIVQVGASENDADFSDRRLIILTDMGIIRKENTDGASSLFVARLSDGTPAHDAEINILGRNGNAVWSGRTDDNGRAELPALAWDEYRGAREPVAIVARRGNDISFIPYNATAPMVDYSKFNVDGEYAFSTNKINAFIFTDRGIYRAGENMVIGGIVKNKSFKSMAGIPVRMEITDPRGRNIFTKSFSLGADGMFDVKYDISDAATTGEYQARLYSLNNRNKISEHLGLATFTVADFVPDNLKITASIAGADVNGWIAPDNLRANVSLRNLFGTAAMDKRISAHATLRPTNFVFDGYTDFTFTPNFTTGNGMNDLATARAQTFTSNAIDTRTNDDGTAAFDITFDDVITNGTYTLTLDVRGFESESGRSVRTAVTTRVAAAKYLVGMRPDGNLKYIARNAERNVRLVALDHTASPIATDGLTMRLVRRENLTSLVKDYGGYYKYQTVTRDNIVKQSEFDIPADGRDVRLDTTTPGTYFMQVLDSADRILANIEYFVAGNENNAMAADTNAELRIKLSASEYKPGDKINVSVTAPYAGAGLITIERDRVYAYKWFNADSTTSVQTITLPDDFDGTGYVNVSFVRSIASRDIFTDPYAYAVAPFQTNTAAHKINVKLSAPETVRDHKLAIKYTTDRDARLMIFAINSGILQVAKYTVPQPLKYFFQKSALQVTTYQTLSLLMPEYKILREFAKTGGGDYEPDAGTQVLNNPFARRTLPPVAFYSGIINATANQAGDITFDLPEYFNGAVRVFAVATNTTAVGGADTTVHVQSPVVATLVAPTFAAPGDTFNISAVISNMSDTSGSDAIADIKLATTDGITLDAATGKIAVPYGTERTFSTMATAGTKLGNNEISLGADIRDDDKILAHGATTATLSLRPVSTFRTQISMGYIIAKKTTLRHIGTDMYPEFATHKIYVARSPIVLARPLVEFLGAYEYPCTEQIVSRAMPYVVAPDNAVLGTTSTKSEQIVSDVINKLQSRQNDDGSFGLWAGDGAMADNNNAATAELTAYVAEFLGMARDAKFAVPNNMLDRAMGYLRDFAGAPISDDDTARAVAHAIFVITQNKFVTTSYINLFQEYADANMKNWRETISGTYIAAAYKMMQQSDIADDIIAKYRPARTPNAADDAMHMYIARRYFDIASTLPASITTYMNSGDYTSQTSAIVVLALADTNDTAALPNDIKITAGADLDTSHIANMIVADIPADADKITIQCDACDGAYFTVVHMGYPKTVDAASNGISVSREYYDNTGNRITSANIGDIITVRVFARARATDFIPDVAITDLMPAGFVPVDGSINGPARFVQVRDDRVVIFADLARDAATFEYNVQITASGEFAIPPIYGESMYNPAINATGAAGRFTVSNGTN